MGHEGDSKTDDVRVKMNIVSFIKRILSKKARFRHQSDILMHYDKVYSAYASKLHEVFLNASDVNESNALRASFVQTAGMVRLIRDDLNIIFDKFYSPSKETVSTRIDLKRLRDEAEILEMLFNRADHPKPLIERSINVREFFAQTLGHGVDRALESQFDELLPLIEGDQKNN